MIRVEHPSKLSREDVAKIEIGRTDIPRWLSRVLVVFLLLTIYAVPAIQHARDIQAHLAGQRPAPWPQCYDIFGGLPGAADVFARTEGGFLDRLFAANRSILRDIHAYEDTLSQESLLNEWLLPPAQEFMTGQLGAGNEKVYIGRGGWLFYRPGIDHVTGPSFLDPRQLARRAKPGSDGGPPIRSDPRPAILQFRDQLAERGIRLIIVPTPDKATVHPERFSGRYLDFEALRRPVLNPSLTWFQAEMTNKGIMVFDPTPILMGAKVPVSEPPPGFVPTPQFLATDTHWRPEAVELVAAELRKFIVHNVKLTPPARPVVHVRRALEVTALGDLVATLGLPKDQTLYRPETVCLNQVLSEKGAIWDADPLADVLLLGDSYSNIYSMDALGWGFSAGLAEQLSHQLARPLDRIVRNDDGAFATRATLARELATGRDRLAGKKLVIWQFAARELSFGDWKLLDMRLGPAPEWRSFRPQRGQAVTVTGAIAAISRPPRPPVVYKDCLITVRLRDLQVDGEHGQNRHVLVRLYGMRDNAWTPAARYRVGDRLTVRLHNWADVSKDVRETRTVDLDDQDVEETPCWGEVVDR